MILHSLILAAALSMPAAERPYIERTMVVTAYCPCTEICCKGTKAPGVTASGIPVRYIRWCAAAPASIPFDTMIEIPGYGVRPVPVLDRGGDIRGNRLDVFFHSHAEALKWGRQVLKVRIYQ